MSSFIKVVSRIVLMASLAIVCLHYQSITPGEILSRVYGLSNAKRNLVIVTDNETARSMSISIPDRSDAFQIMSTEKLITSAGRERDLCLEPRTLEATSEVITKVCDSSKSTQKWKIDEYGRIHTNDNDSLCIAKATKSNIHITSCGAKGLNTNMFVLNAFEETVNYRRNGLKVFSVKGDAPRGGKAINIPKRKYSRTMQQWNFMPSTLFSSLDDIPDQFLIQSVGNSMCIEAEALNDGSGFNMNTCDNTNDLQKWTVNEFGIIHNVGDSSKCINRKWSMIEIGGCAKSNVNMFMFDSNDSSIVWKRNGLLTLTVVNGNVKLSNKVPLNTSQQWSLTSSSSPTPPTPTPPTPTPPTPTPPTPTPPTTQIQYVGNPCNSFFSSGKCEQCTGDCDSDSDCAGDLRCAQRRESTGVEIVPGCSWGNANRYTDDDYCFLPTSESAVVNYVGECGSASYLCGVCEGDCDNDDDCSGNLVCVSRSGNEPVQGCTGEGGDRDLYGKDICAQPQNPTPTPPTPTPPTQPFLNSLTYNENGCTSNSPCSVCEGPCSGSTTCESGLTCFSRSGSEPVPGCVRGSVGDIADVNYCYEDPGGTVTYIPGDLSKTENGLVLSTGLTAKIIATEGQKVQYTGPNGGSSSINFHADPDAGAVFPDTSGSNNGGWLYLSNCEEPNCGVGAITFNAAGQVIKYEMALQGTDDNCGGGKTYWGTWVTCEEDGSAGYVWEVEPGKPANQQESGPTQVVVNGGNYESFAYDARDRLNPTFYVTEDSSDGALTRFTPNSAAVQQAESSGDYSAVLRTAGSHHWLMLSPSSGGTSGTFSWTTNRGSAQTNASQNYPYTEGIDIRNGMMYFVSKTQKWLFILDLDNKTYQRSSTVSGAFDGQPDQIKRILHDDPEKEMLYFCEESSPGTSRNGIHARDSEGNYFSIIDHGSSSSETTGLAFSPDNKHMYVSYQSRGVIYDITREDGYPFGAHRLDIKYHTS